MSSEFDIGRGSYVVMVTWSVCHAFEHKSLKSQAVDELMLDKSMEARTAIFFALFGRKFEKREKGGNHLVPGLDYIVNALKLTNQAPRVSGDSLQKCVEWHCPFGTQHLFCWLNLANSSQSQASNGPVVDSRDLN
ncbi:hypothetical protein TNCV_4887491 [Trichonephila clavipes]|nr:hypothetical protein TNCV_4887491 [Trichonephila clavipes]